MARKVGDHIDLIVGGHSHSLLWNSPEAPSKENISGSYPVIEHSEGKPGHKVLIVTASSFSKYLGSLNTYFDKDGEIHSFDGKPIFLDRSKAEDETIVAALQPYKDKLHALVNEVVSYSKDELPGDPCGSGECALGDVIADSMINATLEKYDTNLTSISFLVRNMIRGSLPKGDINRGDIMNTLPFGNKVVTFVIEGKYLMNTFESCLKKVWVAKPFSGPWMPQVSGLRLTLNTTTGRLVSASVKVGDDFKPLDPEEEYQVSTVHFILKGGNGFMDLKDHSRDVKVVGKDAEVFEKYLGKIAPITPALENRLTIVN